MIEICFSEKELDTIIRGLQEREDRMFRDAEEYKKQENRIAQMDCLNEMNIARNLRRRLDDLAR
jgi:hypothetical protein